MPFSWHLLRAGRDTALAGEGGGWGSSITGLPRARCQSRGFGGRWPTGFRYATVNLPAMLPPYLFLFGRWFCGWFHHGNNERWCPQIKIRAHGKAVLSAKAVELVGGEAVMELVQELQDAAPAVVAEEAAAAAAAVSSISAAVRRNVPSACSQLLGHCYKHAGRLLRPCPCCLPSPDEAASC